MISGDKSYLVHHGIIGQKWGVRRYQNEDGSLTEAGRKRLEKKDNKWALKNEEKIRKQITKPYRKELDRYANELVKANGGKVSRSVINQYNQKMAELMNSSTSVITSPSGRIVTWVAKRGDVGVYMALADAGYDMSQVKNGVWSSGRIAYKKDELDMA